MKPINLFLFCALCVMFFSLVCTTQISVLANEKKASVKASLSHLLQLRRADERYAVRSWMEEHPELLSDSRALTESALNSASMGWIHNALQASEKAVALAPEDEYVLASRAWVLNRSKMTTPALWAARKAVESKTNARNLAIFAEIMQSQKSPGQAEEFLARARKLDPESFDVAVASARIALVKMKGDDALAVASSYLKRHPKDIRALLLRGDVLETVGRLRDSIDEFTAVLNIMPAHSFALHRRAELYKKVMDFARASEDARRLLTLNINVSVRLLANRTLGQSLESKGDLKGALAACKNRLRLESRLKNVDIKKINASLPGGVVRDMVECCRLEIALKKYESALSKLNPLLSAFSDNTQGRELHALALEGLSRWKEALEDWSKLIDRHPSYPKWYSNRARVYKKLGNDAAAKQDLDKASKLSI
ncbi:MAG: tetratricopeptide repeat protein [Candidatus Melainabacteria bacterium]|nr:tetratricopeptide repeat protein [Candidatus Melainabacteria bacterium]